MKRIVAAGVLAALAVASLLPAREAAAGEASVRVTQRPDLKAVFGQVESRDVVPARARLGGTITALAVEEGSAVKAGDVIATVVDDKLALQLSATDARIKALEAERGNAKVELDRAVKLLASGIVPKTKVDQLQTQYDILTNQIAAAKADRSVLEQQQSEGAVLAPAPGRVLSVPVTRGSVVMPGETIARIAGGGYFLRLALPERHAAHIRQGDEVLVGGRGVTELAGPAAAGHGHVAKVYPEIDGGRVLADVEVEGLGDFFVGERTRVWIPVDMKTVVSVPANAVTTRSGIDYVRVGGVDVPVITGARFEENGVDSVEILSGLAAGDKVATP